MIEYKILDKYKTRSKSKHLGPVLSTVLGPILAKIRPKTGLNTKNRFIKQS